MVPARVREFAIASILLLAVLPAQSGRDRVDYKADVKFAIDAIGKECRDLLKLKEINWAKATAPLLAEAKKTRTPEEHLVLLWRLLARLCDGHAAVEPMEAGKGVEPKWPDRSAGPGMFLCRSGSAILVKNAWGPAAAAGIEPGMEITKIDGAPALQWLQQREQSLRDLMSFSTAQQGWFFVTHQGLADAPGTRVDFEFRSDGGTKKRTVTWGKANQTPFGPAFPPPGLAHEKDVHHGRTANGYGYIHVRRCKEDVVAQVERALAAIGPVPGMILDFRGNSGGGFDHEALFGRFLPPGTTWRAGTTYQSQGEATYAGPVVVIVDANVRSAGETAAGIFKEDGRAYMIGESPTAGMSSQKTTIELPSKLFALYVSVSSNKARFQGGRGIEGVGVEPHELVQFAAEDLAAQRDTLIARAEALLADYPQKQVRWVAEEHGWEPPK